MDMKKLIAMLLEVHIYTEYSLQHNVFGAEVEDTLCITFSILKYVGVCFLEDVYYKSKIFGYKSQSYGHQIFLNEFLMQF